VGGPGGSGADAPGTPEGSEPGPGRGVKPRLSPLNPVVLTCCYPLQTAKNLKKYSKYVGLDVHKETIAVAIAEADGGVRFLGEIPNTQEAVVKLVKQLVKGAVVSFCYEAGPCGYVLHRQLVD